MAHMGVSETTRGYLILGSLYVGCYMRVLFSETPIFCVDSLFGSSFSGCRGSFQS